MAGKPLVSQEAAEEKPSNLKLTGIRFRPWDCAATSEEEERDREKPDYGKREDEGESRKFKGFPFQFPIPTSVFCSPLRPPVTAPERAHLWPSALWFSDLGYHCKADNEPRESQKREVRKGPESREVNEMSSRADP